MTTRAPHFRGAGHQPYTPGITGWLIRSEIRPKANSAKRTGVWWHGPDLGMFTTLNELVAVFPTKLAAEEAYRTVGALRAPLRAQRVEHAEGEQTEQAS